jgi:hypothetical protein
MRWEDGGDKGDKEINYQLTTNHYPPTTNNQQLTTNNQQPTNLYDHLFLYDKFRIRLFL